VTERDDRQMSALGEVADTEVELYSRPASYQRPWCRARRATGRVGSMSCVTRSG